MIRKLERFIQALKVEGKGDSFQYRIYDNAPGGHVFNRLDTPGARESRREAWRFLAGHLKPVRPVSEAPA